MPIRLSDEVGRERRGVPGEPAKHLMKASRRTLAVASTKEDLEPSEDGMIEARRMRAGLRSRLAAMAARVREKDRTMGIITMPYRESPSAVTHWLGTY